MSLEDFESSLHPAHNECIAEVKHVTGCEPPLRYRRLQYFSLGFAEGGSSQQHFRDLCLNGNNGQ